MNVLLSIRPKYVEAIMSGNKRYEFRKAIFRNKNIEKVYIYSTAPVKKVVGSFMIGDIIEDYPNRLWEQLSEFSGLNDKEFFSYFNRRKKGFALKIENLEKFNYPLDPRDVIPDFVPPQSFCYLDPSIVPGEQAWK
jgi:predicted transcriptional regulator